MNRDYSKELQNFKAVWERVSGEGKPRAVGKEVSDALDIGLMPRKAPKSRASRFRPSR